MKTDVTKAFVLAAGFGTRLLPLTRVVPKPLLPLWGVPMLDRVISLLASWGVREVVVNVHHGANALVHHLTRERKDGPRVSISFEPEILGTGGALSHAAWFLRGGGPFWMVNADIAACVDPRPIRRAFRPGQTLAAAWLTAQRGPRTVECRDGVVTSFRSERPGTADTYTFCGLHLVDPEVLRYLPETGFASIINAYEKAMKDGWNIAGVSLERSWWSDVGTPAQYLEAHRELSLSRRPFVAVSPGAQVAPGAELRDCVLLPGAVVGPKVRAERMIIGPNVQVMRVSGIMAMRAEDVLDADERRLVASWMRQPARAVACPLSPRGSARTFTRLYDGSRTAVLVRHDPEREENNLYADHARFLSGLGVPVPGVLAEDAGHHLTLFADAGETSVQDAAGGWSAARLETLYRKVLDAVRVMHERGAARIGRSGVRIMPGFDAALYAWEHKLFLDLMLRERAALPEPLIEAAGRELAAIARTLRKLPPVLVHRDLQSSNIMLKGRDWTLIDFQGMRFGPAVYDLASLLCDPYINIGDASRQRLLYHYAMNADPASAVQEMFWRGAVQRLGQALGAYVRLGRRPGMAHFNGYISPALANFQRAVDAIGGLPALREAVALCAEREAGRPA